MRQPKPWFRASKNAWHVEHRGKQVRLGEHPEDAPPPKKSKDTWNAPQRIVDAFYKLMASDPSCIPEPEKLLVIQVFDMFLSHSERHNERNTYLWYKHFLQNFADFYPRLTTSELKPIHVTRWLDDQPNWKGGRRNAVIAIKRVFNWAILCGMSKSPRLVGEPASFPPQRNVRVSQLYRWNKAFYNLI